MRAARLAAVAQPNEIGAWLAHLLLEAPVRDGNQHVERKVREHMCAE